MREVVNLLITCLPPEVLGEVLDRMDKEMAVLGMGREDDWIRKVEDLDWARDRVDDELRAWEEM